MPSSGVTSISLSQKFEHRALSRDYSFSFSCRQSHKSFFEKSDLFFLCMLRPLSFDIQKQELEIEAAQVLLSVDMKIRSISHSFNIYFDRRIPFTNVGAGCVCTKGSNISEMTYNMPILISFLNTFFMFRS